MLRLIVERNQLNYIGLFSSPAFELWGEGKRILRGLLSICEPYGVKLSNLHHEASSLNPSDQEVTINVGIGSL
jgi:hypothetical protein